MRSTLNSKAIGYIVIGLSLATCGISAKTAVDRSNDVQCLTGFIAENARVQKVRSAATIEKDAAVSALLSGVTSLFLADPPRTPAERKRAERTLESKYRKLFSDYAKANTDVAATREKNPLPELPASCDEIK